MKERKILKMTRRRERRMRKIENWEMKRKRGLDNMREGKMRRKCVSATL